MPQNIKVAYYLDCLDVWFVTSRMVDKQAVESLDTAGTVVLDVAGTGELFTVSRILAVERPAGDADMHRVIEVFNDRKYQDADFMRRLKQRLESDPLWNKNI